MNLKENKLLGLKKKNINGLQSNKNKFLREFEEDKI